MLFDTHAHIDNEPMYSNLDNLIPEYKNDGIDYIMLPAVEYESWERVINITKKYDMVYGALGIHPSDVTKNDLKVLDEIEDLIKKNPKIKAIGEIGLDYYWYDNKEEQQMWLRRQLELAKRNDLPVIIHDRDSHADVKKLLDEVDSYKSGVIMHCYSGSVEMAKEYIKKGAYISLGGPVTFKNAKVPKEVAKIVPLDRILVETDSPYLAPHPFRGKTNSPSYVRLVAAQIAGIKGLSLEEFASHATENAKRVFKL